MPDDAGGGPTGQESLVALFDREVEAVFGYLLSRCGSRAVAEDLTSETFAAASRAQAQGSGHQVTGAWLQTVAKRRLIDHWRREGSRRRVLDRVIAEHQTDPPDPETSSDGLGGTDRVDVALGSLPNRQRAALVLRYLDGFSTSEVADAIGVSYKAAESLLSRARRSFEQAYGANDE